MDKDGLLTINGGIVTEVGTFAIEHQFPTREEFSYVIIRNRVQGTDHVFKIAPSGHVSIEAIGHHQIDFRRDGNKFYFDVESYYGELKFKAYPESGAIARVDFGQEYPDALVTTDRKLILEHPPFWGLPIQSNSTVALDTVKSVEFGRRMLGGGSCVVFHH